MRRPEVLLLDEPSNNLDSDARMRRHVVIETWPRTLLVVSRDRELLECVERIGDLRGDEVTWYGDERAPAPRRPGPPFACALVTAMSAYQGALLIASHNQAFLDDISVDRLIELEQDARVCSFQERPPGPHSWSRMPIGLRIAPSDRRARPVPW